MPESDIRYFVTEFGQGVHGRGDRYLGQAMIKARRRARNKLTAPFHRQGHPDHEMALPDLADVVKASLAKHHAPHKEVIRGAHFDEPGIAIVKLEVAPLKSPLVAALEPFVGKSPYELGANGPPGKSDCSGSTAFAADKAYDVVLPHWAVEQGHMPDRFYYFTDIAEVRSGDFVWYRYTRRVGDGPDDYDHVDLVVKRGVSIGSRPSTNGIGYYQWLNGPSAPTPDWAFRKFGRLRAA